MEPGLELNGNPNIFLGCSELREITCWFGNKDSSKLGDRESRIASSTCTHTLPCVKDSVLPDPNKLCTVADFPKQATVKELCSFMGLCSCMRLCQEFCFNHCIAYKAAEWPRDFSAWMALCNNAFTNSPPYHIAEAYSDTSNVGLKAVLVQHNLGLSQRAFGVMCRAP